MKTRDIITAFILFCLLASGFLYWKVESANRAGASSVAEHERTERLKKALKPWMNEHAADPDASVVSLKEMTVKGRPYAAFRIRGRNALGGYVLQDFIASLRGDEIDHVWKAEEFEAW